MVHLIGTSLGYINKGEKGATAYELMKSNNSTNQSVTGVIETNYDNDGNVINKIKHDYNTSKQKLIYPLPDKYSKNQY